MTRHSNTTLRIAAVFAVLCYAALMLIGAEAACTKQQVAAVLPAAETAGQTLCALLLSDHADELELCGSGVELAAELTEYLTRSEPDGGMPVDSPRTDAESEVRTPQKTWRLVRLYVRRAPPDAGDG